MFEQLVDIICNYVEVEPENVYPESRFMEDLGFTSFDFMSMLGEIEETFDVELEQEKAAGIRTVQEAVSYTHLLLRRTKSFQSVLRSRMPSERLRFQKNARYAMRRQKSASARTAAPRHCIVPIRTVRQKM